MNAVKRCLALLAATLVVGACGSDETADKAGTDLTIRATPGAVWMRNGTPATFIIEAVDKLGGPASGSWSVGTINGPMTVVLDTTYQSTSTGGVGTAAKFVVTSTSEGDGDVIINGTGGPVTVPIRIAPDTLGLALVFTSPVQVGDTVNVPLNASVTAHLIPGVRFSSTTTVTMYTGPLTRDTSIFKPINFSIAADSTTLTFTPGPNSTGRARITGIANVSTPSLATFARTGAILKTDQFDTAASTRLVLVPTAPALAQQVVVTLPPEYRFSPTSTVNHFTNQPNGTQLQTNGLGTPAIVSVSADSGTLTYIPAPGASGQPRFTGIRVRNNTSFVFAARTVTQYTIPNLPACATGTYSTTGQPASTPVTISAATYKFRPTSTPSSTGGVFTAWPVVGRAADSSSIDVLPPPGVTKPATISNMVWNPIPALALSRTICDSVTATPPVDMGADDAAGSPVFALPAMAIGEQRGFYDLMSMGAADPTADGGSASQAYTITATTTGTYTFSVQWNSGSDVDAGAMVKDGSYGAGTDFLATAGLSGNKPEAFTITLTAGTTYVLFVIDWEGDSATNGIVQVRITRAT